MGGSFGIRGAFDWLIKLSNNFSDWISGARLVARFRMKRNDECFYEQVAEELKNEFKKEGLWLKALTKCGGNLEKTKYIYIKWRVEQLMDEERKSCN